MTGAETTPTTPIAPAAAARAAREGTRTIVWDTFADGFSAVGPGARWFHVQMGSYVTDDGVATPIPGGGLHVASRGWSPLTGEPAFGISLPHESVGTIPATNDHPKWLAAMNSSSIAGYPGFDAVEGFELVGATRIGGRTFGTAAHPFGAAVADPETDPRLAAFAMTTIDVETFMVFDFFFTNGRVYALYERLPFGRTPAHRYAAFTYLVPVQDRTPDATHDASIAYDPAMGVVRWILDGEEVFRVSRIGRRLERREHLAIDLGGREETVAPRQLDFGMGLFSLLDGALGGGPGLVRLSDALTYYAPPLGEPHPAAFVDDESRPGSRLFGQGAELRLGSYTISYAPSEEAWDCGKLRRSA